MKCISCGAEITDQEYNCPYCGKPNLEAKRHAEEINRIANENQQLKQQVLRKSSKEIYYRIHRRVNIILALACVIAAIVGIIIYSLQDNNSVNRGGLDNVAQLYDSGKLEELYLCLSDADALSKEGYEEYAKAALLWKQYRECQNNYAKALDGYNKSGEYDKFYIRNSVEEGYRVLTNYVGIRYYTDTVSETTKSLLADYRENIIALFTGIYQVPMEKINSFDKYAYKTESELEKYVTEALNAN